MNGIFFMCNMRIEEYAWLSLGFFFVFFVHVGLGYMSMNVVESKSTFEESPGTEIFKNVRIKKVVV